MSDVTKIQYRITNKNIKNIKISIGIILKI